MARKKTPSSQESIPHFTDRAQENLNKKEKQDA